MVSINNYISSDFELTFMNCLAGKMTWSCRPHKGGRLKVPYSEFKEIRLDFTALRSIMEALINAVLGITHMVLPSTGTIPH